MKLFCIILFVVLSYILMFKRLRKLVKNGFDPGVKLVFISFILGLFSIVVCVYTAANWGQDSLSLSEYITVVLYAISIIVTIIDNELKNKKSIDDSINNYKKAGFEEYDRDIFAEDFYYACISRDIKDPEKEYNIEKMKLLAKELNIGEVDYKELFLKGKNSVEKGKVVNEYLKHEKETSVLKAEEQKIEDDNKRFLQYKGREKRIAMLSEYKKELLQKIKDEELLKNYVGSNTLIQKNNPYIVGGIANGIAGPGAGVVAAAETMKQNAMIDVENSKRVSGAAAFFDGANQKEKTLNEELKNVNSMIEKAKILLEDTNCKGLIDKLAINVQELNITKSGSVSIKLDVKTISKNTIHELDAVVDGYLAADVMNNQQKVAEVFFCIPSSGIGMNKITLSGICTKTNDVNANYSLQFKDDYLFLIEK